jgi:hypothetical protein
VNRQLHDSLFELYMQGGLELYLAGTRGLKRDLIIELETSKPSRPLTADAERLLGFTNEKLAHCRSTDVVLDGFLTFLDR